MTSAETQYFALLRAALWDAPAAIDSAVDWQGIMAIAAHHANNVLLSGAALQLPEGQRPPTEMCQQMQFAMRSNLVKQMRLRQILFSAVQLLRKHDIEPVLLKGFGLASLYPNPNLRQFGDIDIFVGLDRFHEACALLRTLPGGYNWGGEVDAGHHYNIEFGQYPMEIHRVSADVADNDHDVYAAIEHDGLAENPQRIQLDGTEISIPSKEFMVFFTFFHAWHHFLTSGVGWRQIADVAMTLHAYHGQLDLDQLHRWLTDMHLMQPWQTFGYLMVQQLGLPESEMPFHDAHCSRRAQKLYRRIMEEGNFRRENKYKKSKPRKAGLGRKIHSFVGVFVDYFHIAKVFPDAASRGLRAALKSALAKNMHGEATTKPA